MSPEIVSKQTYDQRTDLWCVGILTFELLTGKPPFESKTQKTTEKRIKRCVIDYPGYLSKRARDFIGSFLKKNPYERMTLEEAEMHPFIIKNV